MSQHLDLDALADALAAGQEPAHVAGCADCRARLDELGTATTGVTVALTALPAPELPPGLADRLAAALEHERAPGPTNVLPLQRQRTRWLPALGAVAAAAVLVVGGVVLVNQGGGSPSTTADRAAGPGYAVNDTGNDYDATSLAAAVPGLLSGDAPAAVMAPKATTELSTPSPGPDRNSGATAFDTMVGVDPLAALRDTAGLARCLSTLTDPSESGIPLAVDYAMYQGKPALVVVLPSSNPDKVDVFVVPVGCAQADQQVLYFTRLPKP